MVGGHGRRRIIPGALPGGTAIRERNSADGAPSVLYDAVAILCSSDGADLLVRDAAAKDFVTDAFAHAKYIGWTEGAQTLRDGAGVADMMDDGFIDLGGADGPESFVRACRSLRCWEREDLVKQT